MEVFFSFHNLTLNLKSYVLPKLPGLHFILTLSLTIFLPHALIMILLPFAMPLLSHIYQPSLTVTSWPEQMAQFLAGGKRKEQEFILNVQNVSPLPLSLSLSLSWLDAEPPAKLQYWLF